MEIFSTTIPEVKLIVPRRFTDNRGFFCELYHKQRFTEAGINVEFVQDNCSLSRQRGVVRGFHYQIRPAAQAKLIWVVRGAIFDVVVDLRRSSPTFGRHVAMILSAEEGQQLFVPEGFAHAFAVLEPDTQVHYKTSTYYSPEHERGILWNDPALGIGWPIRPEEAIVSEKDARLPPLAEQPDLFD
ncbi:MAG: dTDP-4-dehydrorhamnose 3,5-epimerase [Thermoguttaceae bacterium]|nr:dTDP-4-dehydrorhamnose 3,5-epimerase [Thermoguttaceae bacterium]